MSNRDDALANAQHVEQLADHLSSAAGALHARVVRAIRQRPPAGAAAATPGQTPITQTEAQALFDAEVALRQQANLLYSDAASFAIGGLQIDQQSVLAITAGAKKKIARIDHVRELLQIGADLLGVAAAAVAGKPENVVKALEKMRDDGNDMATVKPEA